MKREIITIGGNGEIHIPTTSVWMSACEIADLFGAFSSKVNAQIKAIFKEDLSTAKRIAPFLKNEMRIFKEKRNVSRMQESFYNSLHFQ